MKKLILSFISILSFCLCFAQANIRDSLLRVSRAKADFVLSAFDSLGGSKMLFSVLDREFYVIIRSKVRIYEYYVWAEDSTSIDFIAEIDHNEEINALKQKKHLTRREKGYLKRLEDNVQTVINGFNTKVALPPDEEITWGSGPPSYFVLKDVNNKVLGDYRSELTVVPTPINGDLLIYLILGISENQHKFGFPSPKVGY